jgi:hypothetical protein
MISLQSRVHVAGVRSTQLIDFMLNCTDEQYQAWWPGTHLAFHTVEARPGYVGNVVIMDEYIGTRRLKMKAVVAEVVPGKRTVWQFKQVVRLPAYLILEAADVDGGVDLTHTVQVSFRGVGRVLDPLFRLYFSPGFERALDEHAQAEFPMLGEMLRDRARRQA